MVELSAELAEELIRRKFESPDMDYKEQFDDTTGAWMELAKDAYGLANYGGGYICFGVKDGSFEPIGLDLSFHKDAQDWADKLSKWCTGQLNLLYLEHVLKVKGRQRKFPILYLHGTLGSLVIPKIDGNYSDSHGQPKTAFRLGIPYTRKNASTIPATGGDFWPIFWGLLKRTSEQSGGQATPLEVISALTAKAKPDSIQETLWFNLFPVTELPDYIHVGDTTFKDPADIYRRIRDSWNVNGGSVPDVPFFLADEKIYTFSRFDQDNPLSICITRKNPPIPTKQWFDDETKHQRLVMLLNFNLKALCRRRGFIHDRRHDRYYMMYTDGPLPEITWKPSKKTTTRPLIYKKVRSDGSLQYFEHFAGKLRFLILGRGIYLVIEPGRVLTEDGFSSLDQRRNVRISTQKNFFYHNNNYLYDMKLWLQILAGNRNEIHFGFGNDGRTTVSVLSLSSKANFGILDDQHTSEDFLDSLKSEPFEYDIINEDTEEDNPLTETSLEE